LKLEPYDNLLEASKNKPKKVKVLDQPLDENHIENKEKLFK